MKLYILLSFLLFKIPCFSLSLKEPINACSFFSSSYINDSLMKTDSCSEFFNPSSVVAEGCQYTEYPPIRGTLTTFWFPYALVEVTKDIGGSIFAESADAQIPITHMKMATAWYQKAIVSDAPALLKPAAAVSSPLVMNPLLSNGSTQTRRDLHTWYVRMLPIPYASLVAGNAGIGDFNPYGTMRGNITLAPGCYDGISEFNPGEWVWGNDDTLLATLYSPFALPACFIGAGVPAAAFNQATTSAKSIAISQVGGLNIPDFNPSSLGVECDRPRVSHEGFIRNFQGGADAINPAKLCMGSLGPLLPRSGKIRGVERYRTAEIAAIKFMSTLGDSTGNFQFHFQDEDKMQQIYPESTMKGCFTPGSVGEIIRYPALEKRPVGKDVYVFVVWRKKTSCLNPVTYNTATIQAELNLDITTKLAVCSTGILGN